MDYSKDISSAQANVQSLSDRLKLIDQMTMSNTGKGVDYIQNLPKTPLENPFGAVKSSLALGTQALLARNSAEADRQAGLKQLADLFGLQQNQDQFQQSHELDLAKLALEVQKAGVNGSNLTTGPDGKLVATGELDDVDANIMAISEGKLFLKDLTPTDRSKISARAQRLGVKLPTEKDQEGNQVKGVIDSLKAEYEGGPGTEDDLSQGGWKGTKTGIANFFTRGNANTSASSYDRSKAALVRVIMNLVGEKGVMTDVDANRLQGLLPKITDNPELAKKQWDRVYSFIESKYGKAATTKTTSGGFTIEEVK